MRDKIEVFDLTHLGSDAHDRAFEDITKVMTMVTERLGDVQAGADGDQASITPTDARPGEVAVAMRTWIVASADLPSR